MTTFPAATVVAVLLCSPAVQAVLTGNLSSSAAATRLLLAFALCWGGSSVVVALATRYREAGAALAGDATARADGALGGEGDRRRGEGPHRRAGDAPEGPRPRRGNSGA